MWAQLTDRLNPRFISIDLRRHHESRHGCIVNVVQLQLKKDRLRGDRGYALFDRLVEPGRRRIGGVGGKHKLGEAHRARQRLAETLIVRDRLGQTGTIDPLKPPIVCVGECRRVRRRTLQVGTEFGVVQARVKVGQVPFGDFMGGNGCHECRSSYSGRRRPVR